MTKDNSLIKVESDLQPTINQLIQDQTSYDPLKDNQYLEEGSFLLGKLDTAKKQIEDQRLAFTKPLNESLKSINNFFRRFSDPIVEADRDLRSKLVKYRQELEEVRKRELLKAEDAGVIDPSIPEVRKKIGAVGSRKTWSFRVIDEKKIPRKYHLVDYSKIRQAIRIGIRDIPGLEIFEEEQITL